MAVLSTRVPKALHRDDDVPTVQLAAFRPTLAELPRPQNAGPKSRVPPKGFQTLAALPEIPHTISLKSLPAIETRASDFSGRGVLGGIADGIAPAPLAGVGIGIGDAIDASLADQPPYLLPGQLGPAYPEVLREAGPDGMVVVRFIIDTLGRAEDPSVQVVQATDPLFAQSVRDALERLRYAPARFSGRRIRVRVEERFEFHLAGL